MCSRCEEKLHFKENCEDICRERRSEGFVKEQESKWIRDLAKQFQATGLSWAHGRKRIVGSMSTI